MKLLLDTHIWIWYVSGSEKIGDIQTLIDQNAADTWLSPVSVWEALLLIEKKKILTDEIPEKWVQRTLQMVPFKQAPLTHEVAFASRRITFSHQDPADRFIAATAFVYDLHLVTMDDKLKVLPIKWI